MAPQMVEQLLQYLDTISIHLGFSGSPLMTFNVILKQITGEFSIFQIVHQLYRFQDTLMGGISFLVIKDLILYLIDYSSDDVLLCSTQPINNSHIIVRVQVEIIVYWLSGVSRVVDLFEYRGNPEITSIKPLNSTIR